MIFVGANIPDMGAASAALRRVMKPGGRLATFDVCKGEGGGEGGLNFPLPFASEDSHCHLLDSDGYAGR